MRKRKIKNYAGMDVIKLNPTDRKDKGWEYDEEVDIDKIPDKEKEVKK